MIHFHMQRFKFIDFMVIELRFKKNKKNMKNMDKNLNLEITFWDITHILHHKSTNFRILVIFHVLSTLISLKVKSTLNWKWKWRIRLYMVFNGDRP